MASTIVPALITAATIASNWPLVVMGSDEWIKEKKALDDRNKKNLLILRVLVILFFPIVPALVMVSGNEAEKKRNAVKDRIQQSETGVTQSDIEEVEYLTKFLDENRQAFLTFKRNELCIELIVQLSIHLTMVLLSQTR